MVPKIVQLLSISNFEPAGSGQANGQISPNFRPRLAKEPNIKLQKTCFIISYH